MQHDLIADALSALKNAERVGKSECVVKASKLLSNIFRVMKQEGYIQDFEFIRDTRGGKLRVKLHGKILDCNVIRPRFSLTLKEFEKWEKRFLPSYKSGILILTTPKGIMSHRKAKELRTGGKLLCFVY